MGGRPDPLGCVDEHVVGSFRAFEWVSGLKDDFDTGTVPDPLGCCDKGMVASVWAVEWLTVWYLVVPNRADGCRVGEPSSVWYS